MTPFFLKLQADVEFKKKSFPRKSSATLSGFIIDKQKTWWFRLENPGTWGYRIQTLQFQQQFGVEHLRFWSLNSLHGSHRIHGIGIFTNMKKMKKNHKTSTLHGSVNTLNRPMDAGRVLRVFALPTKKIKIWNHRRTLFFTNPSSLSKPGVLCDQDNAITIENDKGCTLDFAKKKSGRSKLAFHQKLWHTHSSPASRSPRKATKPGTPKRKLDSSSSKHPFFRGKHAVKLRGVWHFNWGRFVIFAIVDDDHENCFSSAGVSCASVSSPPKKLTQEIESRCVTFVDLADFYLLMVHA